MNLLAEGVAPQLIDNAAVNAGFCDRTGLALRHGDDAAAEGHFCFDGAATEADCGSRQRRARDGRETCRRRPCRKAKGQRRLQLFGRIARSLGRPRRMSRHQHRRDSTRRPSATGFFMCSRSKLFARWRKEWSIGRSTAISPPCSAGDTRPILAAFSPISTGWRCRIRSPGNELRCSLWRPFRAARDAARHGEGQSQVSRIMTSASMREGCTGRCADEGHGDGRAGSFQSRAERPAGAKARSRSGAGPHARRFAELPRSADAGRQIRLDAEARKPDPAVGWRGRNRRGRRRCQGMEDRRSCRRLFLPALA